MITCGLPLLEQKSIAEFFFQVDEEAKSTFVGSYGRRETGLKTSEHQST